VSQHTDRVIWVMMGIALVLAVVPFKYILMGAITSFCVANMSIVRSMSANPQGARRLREWWDSVPVMSVRIFDSSS
jgi:cell division protein FtsW (lipid II flippase)